MRERDNTPRKEEDETPEEELKRLLEAAFDDLVVTWPQPYWEDNNKK